MALRSRERHVAQPCGILLRDHLLIAARGVDPDELGRRGQRRSREHYEAIAWPGGGDRSPFRDPLWRPAPGRHDEQVLAAVLRGGEPDRLAVLRQREVANRQVGHREEGALRAGRSIVGVEIPAIGLESRPALRANEEGLAVRREHRLQIGGGVGRQLARSSARGVDDPDVVVRGPGFLVVAFAARDERQLAAVRRKRHARVLLLDRRRIEISRRDVHGAA